MPAEAAPHSGRVTGLRQLIDLDHPTPYDPTGPPKQTGDHDAANLTRTSHRAKTHLGYRVTQIGTNAWVWRTPHGLLRIVDANGTHLVDQADVDSPHQRRPPRTQHRPHVVGTLRKPSRLTAAG